MINIKQSILKNILKVFVAICSIVVMVASVLGAIGINKQNQEETHIVRNKRPVVEIIFVEEGFVSIRNVDYYELDTRTGIITVYRTTGQVVVMHISSVIITEKQDLEG